MFLGSIEMAWPDYDLAIFSPSALRLCPEPASGLDVDTESSADSNATRPYDDWK